MNRWGNTCEPPGQHGNGGPGDTGIQGDTGICCPGDTGIQGDTGLGDTGILGQQGDTGIGTHGDTGVGDTGIQGSHGDTGVGLQGDTGISGGGAGEEDHDNVIMCIPGDLGLFYEDTNWDVRLRTCSSTPGENVLLSQGWGSNGIGLEVWV